MVEDLFQFHLLLLDDVQLLDEVVEVCLHVGHLLLGLESHRRFGLELLFQRVRRLLIVFLQRFLN